MSDEEAESLIDDEVRSGVVRPSESEAQWARRLADSQVPSENVEPSFEDKLTARAQLRQFATEVQTPRWVRNTSFLIGIAIVIVPLVFNLHYGIDSTALVGTVVSLVSGSVVIGYGYFQIFTDHASHRFDHKLIERQALLIVSSEWHGSRSMDAELLARVAEKLRSKRSYESAELVSYLGSTLSDRHG